MKLYSLYTKTHERLKDDWFLPTLSDEFELHLVKAKAAGGDYGTEDFKQVVLEKSDLIIAAIQEDFGKAFVYSDCDIQFFKPMRAMLEERLQNNDIVCQKDDPSCQLCTGFFIARANERVLRLWKRVRQCIIREGKDQIAFNRNLCKSRAPHEQIFRLLNRCKYACLPEVFFSGGTLTGREWAPGMELPIPEDIVLHHANWTIGVENKIAQLQYVRDVVNQKNQARRC